MSRSGSLARESHEERSIDVPVGLSVEVVERGMDEKMTLLTKLSRLREVNDENIANCGPSTPSPGTLAVGG